MNPQASPLPALLTSQALEQIQLRVLQANDNRRRAGTTSESGSFHSRFRGQGMDLLDVRPYQPGDDIRHIDWRATARSGRTISKVFSEERGRKLLLALDRRAPMFFGTRNELKATSAARAAAILGFSALALREPVATAIAEQAIHCFPATRTTGGLLPALLAMSAPPTKNLVAQPITLNMFCKHLRRQFERHTTLCLISDFHDITKDGNHILAALADHFDLVALQVIDPAEEQLQDTGTLQLRSPGSHRTVRIDTSDASIRHRYQDIMAQRQQTLAQIFQKNGIQSRKLYTHIDTFTQLDGML